MKTFLLLTAALAVPGSPAMATEYHCPVDQKFDSENDYTPDYLAKWQFSVQIVDNGQTGQLSRCGFSSSAKKVTCDSYDVNHIETTGRFNADQVWQEEAIKKYYNFASGLDVQLFLDVPGLPFVENNGRGTIAFGKCDRVR